MTRQFHLDGQLVTYNEDRKIIKTTIEVPFFKAGKILSWSKRLGSPGIGFNHKIIAFVIKTKSYLCVHVGQEGADYWIKNDVLVDFINKNNTEYTAGKTIVSVIPWKLFTRYPILADEFKSKIKSMRLNNL